MFGSSTSKPLFGTSSGTSTGFGFNTTSTPATSGPAAFSFGSTANTKPAFGFGTSTTTTSAAPSFGFGGTATTKPAFGFGTTTTSASTSAFSFGSAATTKPAFGFGASTTTTSAPSLGFGGLSTSTASVPGFGGTGGLLTKPASNFSGFGTAASLTTQNQSQAASQSAAGSNEALVMAAVYMPVVFNDERDGIITKWNQLQAFWGTGKGFINQTTSVGFNPENQFCSFKAVGYSLIPTSKDEDGLLSLITNKPLQELENNRQASINFLTGLLGNQQKLDVSIESIRELPDKQTEMVIYVQEKLPNGSLKRVLASTLSKYLTQTSNISTQLKNAGVTQITPKASMSADALKYYLDTSPAGVDPILWEQAKKDNPDPDKLLPVPMIGFSELHRRMKHQDQQCTYHQARLDIIENEIKTLQQNHATTVSRIDEYKRRHLDLSHRVLKVIVQQEIHRKMGYGIQAEEEQLRIKLESIYQELNAPTQFKSRLNEILSQIRLQNQLVGSTIGDGQSNQVDQSVMNEIKAHLQQQQEGLQQLIGVVKEDLADLVLVETGYTDSPLR